MYRPEQPSQAAERDSMAKLDAYLTQHADRFEEELCELLRIASISADSRHRPDVVAAADWVAGQFRRLGFATDVVPTAGHPIVVASSPPQPGKPTVMVYGHYDVQPVDPLDQWISPPFEPTRRNGNLYARGATDDKGQMFTHIKSAEAVLACDGQLPLNLKFLIEGEEEVGSLNLEKFVAEHSDRLACDLIVISDTSQLGPGQPAITYGLRGIACYELRLRGPRQDLHSGTFGGAITNPARALAILLASLVDDQGRVTLPGFYDEVVPLSDAERQQMAALPLSEAAFYASVGVGAGWGEAGFSALERRTARPTFDVNGIWGGYQGEGFKTVLPAVAGAKFSFRLVPDQDPVKISAALRSWIEQRCPPGIDYELIDAHGAKAVVVPLDSPAMAAASRAIERGFGSRPFAIREGGSIPVISTFRQRLGVDTLLLGWGLNDDNTHSPNEKFCLADFHRGIKASACLWHELAALPSLR
ncbi:MAG: dipeptidase [Pirellulales bacterium]|nr:dipeptidase [Pirellulales bacterium]